MYRLDEVAEGVIAALELVAEVAVAVVLGPMSIIVQVFAHQWFLGRGAAPRVVVGRLGNLLLAFDLADADSSLIAQAAGETDFADLAGVEEIHCLAHAG